MLGKSRYILQIAEKSRCPLCRRILYLLCRRDGNNRAPWFYICWHCWEIAEVGKGKVEHEN